MVVTITRSAAEAATRSGRKAKGDGHLRREEIVAAAERIFVECGYEGATIRRIADEVGVSSTALYMHFRDKAEILSEICERAFSVLLAEDLELTARPMDPVARVRAMMEAYMAFAIAHPHAYQLVYSTPPAATRDDEVTRRLGLQIYDLFRGAVAEAVGAGRLCGDDPDACAQVAWGAAHGIVSLMLAHPGFAWSEAERLRKAALDTLFHGMTR